MRGRVLGSTAIAALLAGCASIATLGDDEIEVTTPGVSGASCELRTFSGLVKARVISPGTVQLNKSSDNLEAVCTKDGYLEARGSVESGFEPWVIGNIVSWGLIGIVVDFAAQNANSYGDVAIFMEPDRRNRDRREFDDGPRSDRMPTAAISGDGGFDTSNAAVYLGFASAQSQADGTAEFMWLAESDLLGDARPVVQQRIDPGTGLPRFHIFGADLPRFDAEAVCDGLEGRGYLCRVVDAQS